MSIYPPASGGAGRESVTAATRDLFVRRRIR